MEKGKNNTLDIRVNTIEKFEGLRKDNSRKIFGILLLVLIADFIYDLYV